MTCRRSFTSSSAGARRSSSTASGWTHPRAHSSSLALPLSGQRSLRPLHRLYESGQYAEAADQGRELIEAHPEYAGPLYNLACCESLAGRTDDAIRHLRLAIDRKESFRSLAAEDSDFDPIRAETAFKELVQGDVGEPTTG
jgi:tetratricopeptide (TPR) repeat protein